MWAFAGEAGAERVQVAAIACCFPSCDVSASMAFVNYLVADNIGRAMAEKFVAWVEANPLGVVGISARLPEDVLTAVTHLVAISGVRTEGLTLIQCEELYPKPKFAKSIFNSWARALHVDDQQCVFMDLSSPAAFHEHTWVDGRIDFSLRWRVPITYRDDGEGCIATD